MSRMVPWSNRINSLIRRGTREFLLSFSLSLCLSLSLPCKDTERRQLPSTSQEETSHQELNWLVPWSWSSHHPELWEINSCCLSHPVYGILFWEPEQTNNRCIIPCYIICVFFTWYMMNISPCINYSTMWF